MKINLKMLLLSTVLICCCAGSAYAVNVPGLDLSFDPAPPFWPGEHVTVTANAGPAGAYVLIQNEYESIRGYYEHGYFASGYTGSDGKFSVKYTITDDAYKWASYGSPDGTGLIPFTAICPSTGAPDYPLANNDFPGGAQSLDMYCKIVPSGPHIPEFPSIVLPVAAILGLVVIFGRKKNMV